eukprot:scaffold58698_cov70-Phaeocystis_antarctica.AAC.7
MSAVLPSMVCSEALALASSRACTIAVKPLQAAQWRAVACPPPFLQLCRLTVAPRCSSIRTIASCPPKAAAPSSAAPFCSLERASTLPPSSSHAATAFASPSSAARHRPSGSLNITGLGVLRLTRPLRRSLAVGGRSFGFLLFGCQLTLAYCAVFTRHASVATVHHSAVAAAEHATAATLDPHRTGALCPKGFSFDAVRHLALLILNLDVAPTRRLAQRHWHCRAIFAGHAQ